MPITVALLIIYLTGIVISVLISIYVEDSDWKFAEYQYIFLYPIIPFIMLLIYLNITIII